MSMLSHAADWLQLMLGADLLRWLGVLGFCTYVGLYTCLSLQILHSGNCLYFIGNICAASLVLLSLSQDFNLAAALIQGFWILMGVPAIALRLLRHSKARRATQDGAAVAADRHRQAASAVPALRGSVRSGRAPGRAAWAARGCRIGTAASTRG